MQTVVANSNKSKTSLVTSGVPEGSVLGPTLFWIYAALIAKKNENNFRPYTDYSDLYIACEADETAAGLVSYINDVNGWMTSNRLKLITGDSVYWTWLEATAIQGRL